MRSVAGPRATPRVDPDPGWGRSRPWAHAARLTSVLVLLGVCWAFSNPPGASPDETDHLVKALGNARFDLGDAGPAAPPGSTALEQRNASTTRVFTIPEKLAPTGLTCFAFDPTVTADCQPPPPGGTAAVEVASPVGAYPPFLYVLVGLAASLMDTPGTAIVAGRLVVVALSGALMILGLAHLIRWTGRGAVLGFVAALTPTALFLTGSLSTSGIEVTAAATVAAVVATVIVRPESAHAPATHWTLLASGTALALSRQLGLLALTVFVLVMLLHLGRTRLLTLLRARQPSLLVTVAVLAGASGAVTWWERTYDQPSGTSSPFDPAALQPFLDTASSTFASSIGLFGWLDTPMPSLMVGGWVVLWVVLLAIPVLCAARAVAVTVAATVLGTFGLAYLVYAGAFFTVGAGIQGRHFLPLFSFALVLAGVVCAQVLDRLPTWVAARARTAVALVVAVGQIGALCANGRRYAVGTDGPWWFLSQARWAPPLGWWFWLLVGAAASVGLAAGILGSRPGRYPRGGRARRSGPSARLTGAPP